MAQVIEIHDFSDPALDVYARATENQLVNRADPANALFIAESPLVIGRALDAGCVPVSFLMEPQHVTGKGAELLARCAPDIPVYTAPLNVLTRLTGFHLTRGILCAMRRPPLPTAEAVCANARRIAVLENVMNPTNLGAIFRCAAGLGIDAVLLTAAGSDPLYRRASRVSMGNVFLIPWAICRRATGPLCSATGALPPPPWHCGRTPSGWTIPCWPGRRSWRWYWARRATASPRTPSPAATTR